MSKIQQLAQLGITTLIILSLLACASNKVEPDSQEPSRIISNYPILKINDQITENQFSVEVQAGSHSMIVMYPTYRFSYFCRFEFDTIPGELYEVVDHAIVHPLTLYRRVKNHWLWSNRLDQLEPVACRSERRQRDAEFPPLRSE